MKSFNHSPEQPPSPENTAAHYAGRVSLGQALGGGVAVATTIDGSEVARTQIGDTGNFFFRSSKKFPSDFRVSVIPEAVEIQLFADVRGELDIDRSIVVNMPTTLSSLFIQANPSQSRQSADKRTRQVIGIRSEIHLGYGIEESVRSEFSHLAFFADAARLGSIDALIQQLLEEMSQTSETEAQNLGRFKLDSTDLKASLSDLDPTVAAFFLPLQRDQTLTLSVVSNTVGEIMGFIGREAATSVLDAGISTGWTKFAEQIGLNFGTTVALDNIQSDLSTVLSGIVDIENEITNSEYQDRAGELTPYITFIEQLSSDGDGSTSQGGIAQPVGMEPALQSFNAYGGLPSDSPLKPTTAVGGFISSLVGFDMAGALTTIADYQIGTQTITSMNETWRQIGVDNVLATTVDQRLGNFPVRSNYWVDVGLQNYQYYSTYQRIASNWLIEIARQNNDLAGAVNAVLPTLQSTAVSLRHQRGMFPYYQISDNMLADLNAGLIWHLETQGPATYFDAIDGAPVVQGTAPNGDAVTLQDWRLPTKEELQFLCDRARFCKADVPSNDTPTPVNSDDGYGDYGAVTRGLQKLGFKNVNTAFTSSSNGGSASDGGVWYLSFNIEGDTWGQIAYAEMQLNHSSGKLSQKGSKDERPYLYVRSIGQTINDPEGRTNNHDTIYQSGTGTPVYLEDVTLEPVEYPGLGVASLIASAGAISYTKFSPTIQYDILTGVDVTMGDDSESNERNLTDYNAPTKELAAYNGSNLNAMMETVWFSVPKDTSSDSNNLVVSNYPPAFSSDTDESIYGALNSFGPVGTMIWQTSDTTTDFSVNIATSTVGYDGSTFPAVITGSSTVTQRAVNDAGIGRQSTLLQVSPRNRIYDSSFGSSGGSSSIVSETYGAALFFDNLTLSSMGRYATWELLEENSDTVYSEPGISISNLSGDEGFFQVDLSQVSMNGTTFRIQATIESDGQTFTDTVSVEIIGLKS